MPVRLGIDVACRAAHQASCSVGPAGEFAFTGRRFRTVVADLERLWASLPAGEDVTVVMEPTRNAWVPLAAWFRRRGATVVLVPPSSRRICGTTTPSTPRPTGSTPRLLARLPLLHPEGLRPETTGWARLSRCGGRCGAGPGWCKRRTAACQRLDALLELLGPAWADVLGHRLTQDRPGVPRRLGRPPPGQAAGPGPAGPL